MFKNFKSNYYKENRSEYFLYFLEGTIFTILIIFIKFIMHALRAGEQSLAFNQLSHREYWGLNSCGPHLYSECVMPTQWCQCWMSHCTFSVPIQAYPLPQCVLLSRYGPSIQAMLISPSWLQPANLTQLGCRWTYTSGAVLTLLSWDVAERRHL